ncbi:MAG TPA: neutral/alkaline non-lysosomal ceramidase N-terminal domain-containing protein [Pseudonocardiaceae bacterium]|jgi:hypothetical protein|nr:neutral/alkaline non-lysosomal ceramidase N-terminal domain-containing protein [Pseudonocardiaceae bacterium]
MTAEGAKRRLWYAATTVDVTPRVPVALGGYLARGDEPATGAHDRLTASLLLLSDEAGQRAACWVSVDALSLDAETCARIRAEVAQGAGIAPEAVLVCCSHTHSAAAAWSRLSFWPNQDSDDSQIDRLVKDISKAATRLPKTRSPVTAGWATVADGGIGANRYDPKGPHDRSAGVLTLRQDDDTIVAILFDYACHPTVLGHANREYSADFPAATRSVAAAALLAAQGVETPPVLAFLQGAAGDVSTRFTRRAQDFAEMQRQGGILAGAVLRGALESEPTRVPDAIPVVHRVTVTVPTRMLPGRAEAADQLVAAEHAWHAERERGGDTPRARIARTRYEGAVLQSEQVAAGLPAHLHLPISVVAFGELAWVHLPIEPFTCYANAIRTSSPFRHTRIVGYTDGYFGYLADAAAHDEAVYEASSSPFDPHGAAVLVEATQELLHGAWRAR